MFFYLSDYLYKLDMVIKGHLLQNFNLLQKPQVNLPQHPKTMAHFYQSPLGASVSQDASSSKFVKIRTSNKLDTVIKEYLLQKL